MAEPRISPRWVFVVLAIGCSGDGNHFTGGTPIGPTSGGVHNAPDAALKPADAGGGTIVGALCQATGVAPESCTPLTGTTGLSVTARETNTTVTVADDGTFSLPGAPGIAKVTLVSSTNDAQWFGGAVTVTLTASGGGRADIPVLSQTDAGILAATNVGGITAGTGILVLHTGPNVTVTDGSTVVYYDAGGAPVLTTAAPTRASGTAVVFGVSATQTVTLVNGTAMETVMAQVVPGAITFLAAPF